MSYDENIYARIITGDVTDAERQKLKVSGEWDEIMQIVAETDQLTMPAFDSQSQFDKVQVKISTAQKKTKIIPLFKILSSIAAVLILGVVSYTFLFSDTVLKSGLGEVKSYSLLDGSKVSLNADSKISFSESEWETKRSISLDGEALFDVESGNTFVVETEEGSVTVLGTVFNVKVRDGYLTASCYEGKVSVEKNGVTEIIQLGEQVQFPPNGKPERTSMTDIKPSWQNGKSRFKKEPLLNFIHELERQFDVSVTWTESDEIFSGEFDHGNLEKALTQICSPVGLTFKIINDKKVEIY